MNPSTTPLVHGQAPDIDVPYPRELDTVDPGVARKRTQEFLGQQHRMKVLEREHPFLARVRHRSLNGLGLMSSQYGAAVEISCAPPISIVTVSYVAGGRMLIESGPARRASGILDTTHAMVYTYAEDVAMRWAPGLRQLMLTIDRDLVTHHLRNLLNEPPHDPLIFDTLVDLNDSGQGVTAAVRTFRQALELCGTAEPPPVLAKEIEHSILTALLLGLRHNYTNRIFSVHPLPAPRVIRRVVELIHASPDTAFTVADLAAHAGVSERSLHAAFQRQFGTSPMSYVRRHRIERAHEELLGLDPSAGIKVADVALRHGFTHTGRFAAMYRERFGESPSETMRR